MIAAILLAAGRGIRFGSDKRMHEVHGRPLIDYAFQTAGRARITRLDVVIGPNDGLVRAALEASRPEKRDVVFVVNDDPHRGMMSSLKAALVGLPETCKAAVVLHADMPLVPRRLIDRLIAEHRSADHIVVPTCSGRWRHPRLIPAWLFDEFLSLADGEKGLSLLEKHPTRISLLPCHDESVFIDVDTVGDIDRVAELLAN